MFSLLCLLDHRQMPLPHGRSNSRSFPHTRPRRGSQMTWLLRCLWPHRVVSARPAALQRLAHRSFVRGLSSSAHQIPAHPSSGRLADIPHDTASPPPSNLQFAELGSYARECHVHTSVIRCTRATAQSHFKSTSTRPGQSTNTSFAAHVLCRTRPRT